MRWRLHEEQLQRFWFLKDSLMAGFNVRQSLRAGVPMIDLAIVTQSEPPDDQVGQIFQVTGIIDTGSPACIVNVGVLPAYFFQDHLSPQSFRAFSGVFKGCQCATMGLWFEDHWKDAFEVAVFEKSLGEYEHGEPFMLLGRSFLHFGTFTYDGPNQEFTWAYNAA
jgi:hypothetical protein